jgi:anti-sigma regulatory factor (Ser/Thr protein kinase)
MEQIQQVLKTHLNYKNEDSANLLTALAELCQNIVDHSESSGFAAMQVYTSQRDTKYAVIGVGDSGIGIRESLSKRYDTKRWTDAIAIRNALKPHFSRLEGRGLGLTRVKEIAEKYNGTLILRSHKGLVTFHRKISSRTTIPFSGTQISIYLRENRRLL